MKYERFYLPSQAPNYCIGCKKCFLEGEHLCPHADAVQPIFQAMLDADLIVFAYPVYALRAPAAVKSVLDHIAYNWLVHRPNPRLFTKTVAILTQSIGAPNGAAQKDVKTSMNWLGISRVKSKGMGMMEGIIWEELSQERKDKLERKVINFANKFHNLQPAKKSFKTRAIFQVAKMMQKNLQKKGGDSLDLRYWQEQGWV